MALGMVAALRPLIMIWSTLVNRVVCGVSACSMAEGAGYSASAQGINYSGYSPDW